MKARKLGIGGPSVFPLGLGCSGLSGAYGPVDEAEGLATIRAALDAGVTLLDTADFYGMGHNELQIGRALKGRDRDRVTLSVKFGAQRDPDGAWLGMDGRPASVKTALAYTLRRLGTDYVDVYRPARLDPAVPVEDTVGAIADMVRAGHVRYVGLSEVGVDTLRRACAVHPISDLQVEYSLVSRGVEREILPTCRELGVGVTAYGVLSRGLLGGRLSPERAMVGGRAHSPRFQGANLDSNMALVERLRSAAGREGLSVSQAAIAWVLSRGVDVIPIVGARTEGQLEDALLGLAATPSAEALGEFEAATPVDAVAGDRYAPAQMAMLDSERKETGIR